ncbi:hypothetical protein OZX69_03045 [Lactobacillus sp. ESL0731]|uniref:hypothetical protein n=1 Tax=unclassified Lactobacillus TaxID=2620435 RepID=UPI0023F6F9F9|nr:MULTISPECIES: hypothetical protein [unclassified Lactobacillus]WEV51686.1 hypothetical protein OZX63_03045 [Lactobacillus sp. ESL0700]WEV62815.1 hypothetical protein OZX69_03045 [Lactobacillus sp. ESL0731]
MIFNGKEHDHFYLGGYNWRQNVVGKNVLIPNNTSFFGFKDENDMVPTLIDTINYDQTTTITGILISNDGTVFYQCKKVLVNQGGNLDYLYSSMFLRATEVKIISGGGKSPSYQPS